MNVFILTVLCMTAIHATVLQITTDFPSVALMMIKSMLSYDDGTIQLIMNQYKTHINTELKNFLLVAGKPPSNMLFKFPDFKSEQEQQIATSVTNYLKQYHVLQVSLYIHYPNVQQVELPCDCTFSGALKMIEFLFQQAVLLFSQVTFPESTRENMERASLVEDLACFITGSISVLPDLFNIDNDRDICRFIEIMELTFGLSYRSKIMLSGLQSVHQLESSGVFTKVKVDKYTYSTVNMPITMDKLLESTRRFIGTFNLADLPLHLIDNYDRELAERWIMKSIESVLFVKNAKSGLELVQEYKRANNPILLSCNGPASLLLTASSFSPNQLEGQSLTDFGSSRYPCIPPTFQVCKTIRFRAFFGPKYMRVTIPNYLTAYFQFHIAPRLTPSSAMIMRVSIFRIAYKLHQFCMSICNSDDDVSNLVQDIKNALNKLVYRIDDAGIHGRFYKSHLLQYVATFIFAQVENETMVVVDGYEERSQWLSNEKFFELKCLEALSNKEFSKIKHKSALINGKILQKYLANYMSIYGQLHNEEADRIFRMVSFTLVGLQGS